MIKKTINLTNGVTVVCESHNINSVSNMDVAVYIDFSDEPCRIGYLQVREGRIVYENFVNQYKEYYSIGVNYVYHVQNNPTEVLG